MEKRKEVFKSRYFTVEELTRGVYAAVADEEGGALSNSGIIDLGDKTVVFDTSMSFDAAKELRRFAEEATGRKVSYVVNSHSHFDHVLGNCAFDGDTEIVSGKKVYDGLKAHENEVIAMKKDAPQLIRSLKDRLDSDSDKASKAMIERDINFFEMVGKQSFSLRLPGLTFEGSMELAGTERKALLLGYMKGHTDSDIVLYLPGEKIAFMGDLLFTGTHPWLGAGDPEEWLDALQQLKNYEVHILVPGHGRTGTFQEIALIEQYIKEIAALAAEINEGRLKLEELREKMLPGHFASWKGNKFLPNVKFYCEYLKSSC